MVSCFVREGLLIELIALTWSLIRSHSFPGTCNNDVWLAVSVPSDADCIGFKHIVSHTWFLIVCGYVHTNQIGICDSSNLACTVQWYYIGGKGRKYIQLPWLTASLCFNFFVPGFIKLVFVLYNNLQIVSKFEFPAQWWRMNYTNTRKSFWPHRFQQNWTIVDTICMADNIVVRI